MKELEILLLMAIVAMGILLIILLQKITVLKKQTDDIIKEVKDYVTYVTQESPEEEGEERKKTDWKSLSAEEKENHIIQTVLGEYFP